VLATFGCLDSMAAPVGCGDTDSTGDVVITVAPSGTYTYVIGGGNGGAGGVGTVTSVGFTGGLISVASATTTPALTVAGTSGGVPYFSSTSTWASSGALTASAIMLGGGAGSAPTSLGSLGTTTTILHGNAAGAPTFGAVVSADMNITTTTCTNQLVSAISAGGVGTCVSVANAMITNGTIDLTAKVTGLLPTANGGLNNAFFAISGPASSTKTYTFPNASATVLTTDAAVTVPQGGTGAATLTNHGVLLGQGTSAIVATGAGTTDYCLVSNGASADPAFEVCPVGTIGSDTQVSFNDAGTMAGDSGLTFNKTTNLLTATGGFASGSGSTAGLIVLLQGTACTPATNEVCIYAPASVTAYGVVLPSAVGSTGFAKWTVSGSVATISSATIVASDLPAIPATSGTSITLSDNSRIYTCTNTCTITVPVPAAGVQYCVRNGNNVTTVITLAALGSSAMYENTAGTAYGTAGTGTLVSGGAANDKICIVGLDSTHYQTWSFNGTWTAS